MLKKQQMQEIQDLKLRGYTQTEIIQYFINQGLTPPTRQTIAKYYKMDVVPDNPREKLAKDKVFDIEPFRSTIIAILEANNGNDFCVSSVYDLLEEKFIENGDYDSLPGNEQTLRNYVHYLEDSGKIDTGEEHRRIYDHVFDTPPGEQMLIDFGEVILDKNHSIHFICLLLRYSRLLCVYAQDHKYNAVEACQAIYRCFCRIGGRPSVLVIDQDAVFVASETYGEVVKTRVFEDFCTEQELKLWVCNKADPESKGPIENSVGFVKKNFFSARTITCIDDVWRSLPGWLERKNKRIHRATLRIPIAVFVPREYAYSRLKYKITVGKIHIYDEDLKFICTHLLSERKNSYNLLPEHRKGDSGDWIEIMERLRDKWNCYDFQHFINGVKKENPRHISKQLSAIERFLDSENPDRALVADVLKTCCNNFRYQFSQFKVVYEYTKAGKSFTEADGFKTSQSFDPVEYKSLDVYGKAFNDRVNSTRKEAVV